LANERRFERAMGMSIELEATRTGTYRPHHLARLITLMVLGGIGNLSLTCGPVLATQLSSQLHLRPTEVGWFFAAEYGGYLIGGLAARWLLPRFPWRRQAVLYLCGFLAGSIISALFSNLPLPILLLIRLPTATCSASLGIICMATANDDRHPSRALSLFIMGQLIGGMVGLSLFPALLGRYGLAGFFLPIAVAAFASFPLVRFLANEKSVNRTATGATEVAAPSFLWLRFPAILLFYFGISGIWTFAGAIASTIPLDTTSVGRALSIATVAGLVGSGIAASLKQVSDPRIPIAVGYVILLLGTAAFAHPAGMAMFTVAALGLEFAWCFVIPFILSAIGRFDQDGSMIADINLVIGIGLAVGPALGGMLIERFGGFTTLLVAEGSLLVLAWLCAHVLASPSRQL
jgi:MFS transporter, DHA1 family, inner membrane transport protein